MLIEFRCPNHSEFDAAKGRFVACGELIVTSDENVGQTVECPKCKSEVEVPFEVLQKSRAGDTTRTSRSSSNRSSRRQKPSSTKIAQKATTVNRRTADGGSSSTDIIDRHIEPASTITANHHSRPRCPECGALLSDDGQCSLCHYVAPEYLSRNAPNVETPGSLTGFQLWLSEMMTGGVSLEMMAWIVAVLFSIAVGLIVAVLILLHTTATYVTAAVLLGFYAFFLSWMLKARQMALHPEARLTFWQRPFWNAVLMFSRLMKWEGYDSRLKGRVVIDLRNAPITDERIPEIEGLKKCQVLDLENTMITDRALNHLYGLPFLQCLVVRKTNVTPDAVRRFQQAHPRLWIWD